MEAQSADDPDAVDRGAASPWMVSIIGGVEQHAALVRMKMELPSPVYGHGFGPPPIVTPGGCAVVLDLSAAASRTPVSASVETAAAAAATGIDPHPTPPFASPGATDSETGDVDVSGRSSAAIGSIKHEPESSSPEAEAEEDQGANGTEDDEPASGDEEHCSRTMPTMTQEWLAKWRRRRELVKRRPDEQQVQVSVATDDATAAAPKRKALIRPQRKTAAPDQRNPSPIPVGIALARQRTDKSHKRAASPRKTTPAVDPAAVQEQCPASLVAEHFAAPSIAAQPVFNPALYPAPSWPMWPVPDYGAHPFWPAPVTSEGYAAPVPPPQQPPPPQPPQPSAPAVIHHHQVADSGIQSAPPPPSQPPLLLIPCLDPYQRTAMFWGYHHHHQIHHQIHHHHTAMGGSGIGWTLPGGAELHHPTPAPSPWPVVPRPFDIPALIRTDMSGAAFAPADAVTFVRSDYADASTPPASDDAAPIKCERVASPVSPADAVVVQTIRVRDNLMDADDARDADHVKEAPDDEAPLSAEYSGLQLLSDSIERFVSRDRSPPTQPTPATPDVATGNALDVLCAAALCHRDDEERAEPPTPSKSNDHVAAAPTRAFADSSPAELDFRSKLAELQRMYREKQQMLKHLKPKRKDKSDKKKKSSSTKKKRRRSSGSRDEAPVAIGDAAAEHKTETSPTEQNKAPLSDLIIPGRLELASSTRRPPGDEDEWAPKMPSSYAAALASAAVKKKRKPDCPVRKHDTEPTETIVPSKKRKFIQLFRWCHSSSSSSAAVAGDSPVSGASSDGESSPNSHKKSKSPSKKHENGAHQKPKIKPKLKAEVQLKQDDGGHESNDDEWTAGHQSKPATAAATADHEMDHNERLERHCLPALQLLHINDDGDADEAPAPAADEPADIKPVVPDQADGHVKVESSVPAVAEEPAVVPKCEPVAQQLEQRQEESAIVSEADDSAWKLKQEALSDGLRVLIAEDGLLLAGTVTGICPPDIYGVAVDGERGCRPRILSTEELLREAVTEVRPLGLHQLDIGTRVCAYWSRKSRTLYPGVVSSVHPAQLSAGNHGRSHANKEDEIDVEFDDGDSGRMPISLIRLLPPDYPVTERDPNPLETLESRRTKRRASEPTPETPETPTTPTDVREKATTTAAKKSGKKASKRDESKENNDDNSKRVKSAKKANSKPRHSKKHKTKRSMSEGADQPSDLIIPVSPGLAIEHAADEDEVAPTKVRPQRQQAVIASIVADDTERAGDNERQNSRTKANPAATKGKIAAAALLPERQLWEWLGPSFKKASKGKGRKEFYKAIHRGDEIIRVGDCAVFLSAGRQDRPYVGRIELLWESWGGSMTVKVRWFYHPEETCGGHRLTNLKTPGALFESNHMDENDVQTISHCCTVSSLDEYRLMCRGKRDVNLNVDADGANGVAAGYDHFYLAGFYDPTSGHLSLEPGVLDAPSQQQDKQC